MGFAYAIIVVLIDSFNAVIQDAILRNSNSEEHQSALTYLSLSYKIFKAIFGCCTYIRINLFNNVGVNGSSPI